MEARHEAQHFLVACPRQARESVLRLWGHPVLYRPLSLGFPMNWDQILKIVVPFLGAVVSLLTVVGYLIKRWVKSLKKNAASQVSAARFEGEARVKMAEADAGKRIAELESAHAQEKLGIQQETLRLQQACRELEIERDRVYSELTTAQKQLADLESFDGRLWERGVTATPPLFLDPAQRRTRLVSVMNLKGGVGKTTLTANIGVGLARKGFRVLLVDLDFQGSLTRLCQDLDDTRESLVNNRTVNRFLSEEPPPPVGDITRRVRGVIVQPGCCDLIPAGESLAEAELRAQGRWFAASDPDVRFLFRRSFHAAEVCDRYDYVIFDCPPRLTTASINALACSDYLLVPVVLEQGSVEALPRTLTWLNKLPHVARARLLGVVANRVEFWGSRMIAAQQTVYNYLSETVSRGHGDSAVFRAVVRNNRAKIEDAANAGRIASAKDDGLELFSNVVDEVEKGTRP
jgi:cellulose biosynthesis protein BcsQ